MAHHSRTRPFEEVPVRATLGQKGKDRFDKHHKDEKPEHVCHWRCNLTALSQVHNLYFIACADRVHVHIPAFPDQTISRKPLFIFPLPVTRPHMTGYIDHEYPHAVNQILVDFLGLEEVLLVACDDGDVIGFFLHDIVNVASFHDSIPSATVTSDEPPLRPFFKSNVGMSAWGLAIHSEARLIAVSANTHRVTVFALALSSGSQDRQIDSELRLPTVGCNIPSVQFNNTGSDPSGNWLLFNTIDGDVFVAHIPRPDSLGQVTYGAPLRRISIGICAQVNGELSPMCMCRDRYSFPHSVWNALFLNPRSFKDTNEIEVTLGTPIREDSSQFWDISASKTDVCSRPFFPHLPTTTDDQDSSMASETSTPVNDEWLFSDGGAAEVLLPQEDPLDAPSFDDETHSIMNENTPQPVSSPGLVHINTGESIQMSADDVLTEHNANSSDNIIGDQNPSAATVDGNLAGSSTGPSASTSSDDYVPLWMEGVETPTSIAQIMDTVTYIMNGSTIELHGLPWSPHTLPWPDAQTGLHWTFSGDSLLLNGRSVPLRRAQQKLPYCYLGPLGSGSTSSDYPDCPMLIVAKKDVFLLQSLRNCGKDVDPPVIALHDLLFQEHTRSLPTQDWDRMCYLQQIPELGVVIVASSIGRAAILTLTRNHQYARDPDSETIIFGFRLDHILPFPSQETEGFRPPPSVPLIGIAVSPVQGSLGVRDGARRWRLLLYYADHTVLPYEIGKTKEPQNQGIESLVL